MPYSFTGRCHAAVASLALLALAPAALAQPITIERVAYQGQVVQYNKQDITLGTLNAPFVNSLGQVGFLAIVTAPASDRAIWVGDGIVFLASDDTKNTVVGGEGSIGISDAGGFIYSPTFNGEDSVYTHDGLLLVADQPLPNSGGLFSAFNSRPSMIPDGTAYWVGGTATTAGGATSGRRLLRATDTSDPNSITSVLTGGDIVGGVAITATGIEFQYSVSDNGLHHLNQVTLVPPTANDAAAVLNGQIVAREGFPAPNGANWVTIGELSVNNCGNWVMGADTNAATTADEIITYNGTLALAEGQVIDGVALTGVVIDVAINNLGRVLHIWDLGTPDVAFVGRADDLSATSQRIIGIGDAVDYTGDGIGDATVTDLEVSATISLTKSLPDDDFLYLEVTLQDLAGGTEYEAMIRVPLPPFNPCPADVNDSGAVDVDDLIAVILGWGPCASGCPQGCPADTNGSSAVDVDDLIAVILGWGPCP